MNNEEAKLILQAYRPAGQDADDPRFREALEQAQRDPELAKWFANEHALDSRISAKVKASITTPARLKSHLLAQRKIVRNVVWWRRSAWQLAAAASVLLLAALAVTWLMPSHAPQFAGFQQTMVQNSLKQTDHLNFMTQDMAQIRDWLKTQHAAADFDLPVSLRDAPVHGCRVIDWHGHKVTLLCFMPNGSEHVDLFVIDCTHFRDFMPSETAQFATSGGVTTAIWCRYDKTYLVASTAGEQQLRRIL
jgi:hypothetical protein